MIQCREKKKHYHGKDCGLNTAVKIRDSQLDNRATKIPFPQRT